jgi:hypothetical protein
VAAGNKKLNTRLPNKMKAIQLTIANKSQEKMLVFVEPEAMDYWVVPDEEIELVAERKGEKGRFEIQYTEEGLTVLPSKDCGIIFAFKHGKQLETGYQRPADW